MPESQQAKNLWICKPSSMNQGRGIEVFKSFDEIRRFVAGKAQGTEWIVQKYLEKPLLYRGRKFDIRMWVVVGEQEEVFFYNEGYIRTSSYKYKTDSLKESYVHLTNNCLQRHGQNYGAHEEGNTVSYEEFESYLSEEFPDLDLSFSDLLFRAKDIVIDTVRSCSGKLNPEKTEGRFELFGYDFIIDEDF